VQFYEFAFQQRNNDLMLAEVASTNINKLIVREYKMYNLAAKYMKGKFGLIVLCLICLSNPSLLRAQSIPVGSIALDDYYRRQQLLGKVDSSVSFTIRPLTSAALNSTNIFETGGDSTRTQKYKSGFKLLPVSWQQQYTSHHPYGWNDGAMIRAKGYQTMVSAGVYAKYKILSIQIRPEFVFAENKAFLEGPIYSDGIDLPERYGNRSYNRLLWGQSNVRLNFGPVSLGLSNENLWWGPGIRNSLLMSNSAQGFKHLTLNTVRPLRTALGSIEGQIIAGRLEGSGFTASLEDDWRYLSAIAFTYQPKWVPGLFLGISRSFQTYHENLKGLSDYIPLFRPYQKAKDKNQNSAGSDEKDQLTSVYARWLLTKARAEVYFEYGANDNSYDLRDFTMSPEHSRAYIVGMSKLIPFKNREDEHIRIGFEITHMEQSIDRLIRNAGGWYSHFQIREGYTNRGEVLGAGVGPGGNLVSLDVSWYKGIKHIGLQLERYEHNGDNYDAQYSANQDGRWVDFSAAAISEWEYKPFIFNGKLQAIKSLNYHWLSGQNGLPLENVLNIQAQLGITYRF
jgi:hypothetical protein